jgi:hypothetical protein
MRGAQTFWRDTAILALIAAAARVIFLLLLPEGVESVDLHSWQLVAAELRGGRNPYHTTPFLNWPPLWMQLIAAIDKASQFLHVPFRTLLRLVLIGFDVAIVIVAHRIAAFMGLANARTIVLIGLALNPICILLIVQHANFDSIVALAILLAVWSIARFALSGDSVDWLYGALAIGTGILVKTIPVILFPLLASHWRTLNNRTRILGVLLFAGPVALGISILFTLTPQDILQKVIQYRSYGGVFGVSGILAATVPSSAARLVRIVLLLTLGAIVMLAVVRMVRDRTRDSRRLVLLAAFLLIAIILLGPGYGPQYITWFLPLLVLTATSFDSAWRRVLIVWGAVAVVTYLIEYLLMPSQGALLVHAFPAIRVNWAAQLSTPKGMTMFRLPLFAAYCVLWIKAGTLLSRIDEPTDSE